MTEVKIDISQVEMEIQKAKKALHALIKYITMEDFNAPEDNVRTLLTLRYIFDEFAMEKIAKRDLLDISYGFILKDRYGDTDNRLVNMWDEWIDAVENIKV